MKGCRVVWTLVVTFPIFLTAQERSLGFAPSVDSCVQFAKLDSVEINHSTWKKMDSATLKGATLTSIQIVSPRNLFAAGYVRRPQEEHTGGILLHSEDGGNHWKQVVTGAQIHDLSFSDSQHGIAVGANGIVLTTSDAGTTWSRRDSNLHVCSELQGVSLNGSSGLAVGIDYSGRDASHILTRFVVGRTIDFGQSWTLEAPSFNNPFLNFRKLLRLSPTTLVAVSAAGFVSFVGESSDNGKSWTVLNWNQPNRYVFLSDATLSGPSALVVGVVYEGNDPPKGALLKRSAAQQWTLSVSDVPFIGISSTSGSKLFALGINGWLLESRDGGSNWTKKQIPHSTQLLAIVFETDLIGFVAGADGEILRTIDGGNTWTSARGK